MTAKEAKDHPWFERAKKAIGTPAPAVSADIANNIQSFGRFGVVKKLATEIVAHSLQPEDITRLRGVFQGLDSDSKGSISKADFVSAMASGGETEQAAAEIFDALDIDRSGALTYNEWVAGAMSQAELTTQRCDKVFDRLADPKTGSITVDRLKALVGVDMTVEELSTAVKEIDSDGKSWLQGLGLF
ncbi:unnamed protein product [Chrysoparadoxa australica]